MKYDSITFSSSNHLCIIHLILTYVKNKLWFISNYNFQLSPKNCWIKIFFSLQFFYFMKFQIDLHLVILYLIVVSQISISSTIAFYASISFSSQLAQLFFLTYGRINLFWDLKSENWVRKRERYVFELIRSIQPIVSITHLVLLRVNLFRRNMI